MPALKKSAVRYLAGFAASAFLAPAICAAAQVKVNDEAPLDLQSPPGFTYVNQGSVATLSIATDGFMMCANIIPSNGQALTNIGMAPQHGQWRFPTAVDLRSVGYGNGTLAIGRSATGMIDSYLVCHTAGPEGEILTPLADGVMRSGFDSKMVEQFTSLVNWIPGQGFSWSSPDWTQVPTDPCSPSADQPARVTEDIACMSVSGSKPAGVGSTERSPTIWTATDNVNFYYVVRVDARWGAQNLIDGTGSALPTGGGDRAPDGTSAEIKIAEAYNRGVVGVGGGYLGDTGQWCVLEDLPTALNGNMCSGAANSGVLNGPFVNSYADNFQFVVGLPPSAPRASFYMGFIRPIVSAQLPPIDEPVVAVSVLLDPTVSGEGGDHFRGDDVAFGFLPTSQGFPWMHGGQ
jgi:hypothetical protein